MNAGGTAGHVKEATAQAAVLALPPNEVLALKVPRQGGKVDPADIDFPLPDASAVQAPTNGQLNRWLTGPVLLSEVDCSMTHIIMAGCPLATYM